MYWFKRKPQMNDHASAVSQLASRLGVERRFSPRILCPKAPNALLPAISFDGRLMQIHNISVGGCCLIDPNEFFGPAVGQETDLDLAWQDHKPVRVRSRIVSSVDNRRGVQFLNLPTDCAALINQTTIPGIHGEAMRVVLTGSAEGPLMQAREVWSSLKGDSVTIEDNVHRLAEISLAGERYQIFREAWPTKDLQPLTKLEFAGIILFLTNIPQPTDLLVAFTAYLEEMAAKGAP